MVVYGACQRFALAAVGGTRERHFAGTNSKPRKRLENAATPTRRAYAVWVAFLTGLTTPLSADSCMQTYFPWRIKMIVKISTAEEITTEAAKCQALGI